MASAFLETVCRSRIADPQLLTEGFSPVGSCDKANPRVLSALMLDPPECVCRPCAAGNTSIGGFPEHAVCYDAGASPQEFSVIFGMQTLDEGRRRLGNEEDVRVLNLNDTMLAQIGMLLTNHMQTVAAQQLFGAPVGLQSLSVRGQTKSGEFIDADDPGTVRYYSNVSFVGASVTRQALVEAINAASSCDDPVPVPNGDDVLSFCANLAAGFGGSAALQHIRAYDSLQPPLDGLTSSVMFAPAALNALFLILSRVFTGSGKFLDQRNKVGSMSAPVSVRLTLHALDLP